MIPGVNRVATGDWKKLFGEVVKATGGGSGGMGGRNCKRQIRTVLSRSLSTKESSGHRWRQLAGRKCFRMMAKRGELLERYL